MTGLSCEVLKNLVLAGVRASVCDNRPYPDAIIETPSFFIPRPKSTGDKDDESSESNNKRQKISQTVAEAMQQPIEELNPLLGTCEILNENVENLSNDVLGTYDIIIASRISITEALRITAALHNSTKKGKFFMVDSFGMAGVCCLDLGKDHTYRDDIGKTLMPIQTLEPYITLQDVFETKLQDTVNRFHKVPPPTWVKYRCILEYVNQKNVWPSSETANDFVNVITEWIKESSPSMLDVPDSIFQNTTALQDIANLATSEVAPVCAVLGGLVSNEVIKAISGKGSPSNNTILFDGLACKAWSFLVQKRP